MSVLEHRPALKHLMDVVQYSSRALRRLMHEARNNGDPAPVLRTCLAEASNISKAAVKLAVEIGRVVEENPAELRRNNPPKTSTGAVLDRLEIISERLRPFDSIRIEREVERLRDHPDPRTAISHDFNRHDTLRILKRLGVELEEGEEVDLRVLDRCKLGCPTTR